MKTPQNPPDPTGFAYTRNDGLVAGTLISLWLLIAKGQLFVMVNALKEALPIVQALILMGLYMLLPFLLVFSGYRLEAMVLGAIGISGDSSDNDEAAALAGIASVDLVGDPGT